jgi:hypothetical protein
MVAGRVNSGLDMEWKESVVPHFEETFHVFRNLVGNIEENHKEFTQISWSLDCNLNSEPQEYEAAGLPTMQSC